MLDQTAGASVAARDVLTLPYTVLREYTWLKLDKTNFYFEKLPRPVQDYFYDYYANPEDYADQQAWAYGWLSYAQEWWKKISQEI
jgi:hypothetical protein